MNSLVLNRFYVLLAVLLLVGSFLSGSGKSGSSLWAQTGAEQAGLGVFGPVLGIHGDDTLVINGSLILNSATVVGMGTLSLRSRKPQPIIAYQSRVRNLHLATAGTTLCGDLIIENSLTIDGTTLDTRLATLTMGDSARLWLRHGGQLKREPSLLTTRAERTKAPVPIESRLAITSADLRNKLLVTRLDDGVRSETILLNWRSRPVEKPSPPPEA